MAIYCHDPCGVAFCCCGPDWFMPCKHGVSKNASDAPGREALRDNSSQPSPSPENEGPPVNLLLIPLLLCGSVFSGLIFVVLGPILPALAQNFNDDGNGDIFAQWVMTVPAIGLVIGGLFGGWIFDRFGPKILLPLLLTVYGLAGVSGIVIDSQALLLASRLIIGFCASVIALGTTVLIAEAFDDVPRAKMLGYKNAIAAATGIVGMLIAGQIAGAWGWRVAFLIYGVALLLVVPAVLGLRGHARSARSHRAPKGGLRALLRVWPIYASTVLFGILVMAPLTQLPFLLREIDVTGAQTLSIILGFTSVGSAVGAFLYGRIFQFFGGRGTILFNLAIWATGMAILGTTQSALQAGIGCLLAGIAGGIWVVHMANLLMTKIEPLHRGRAMGLLYVALFTGDFLTPLALIPLAEIFGRHMVFLILTIPCLLGLAGVATAMVRSRNTASLAGS